MSKNIILCSDGTGNSTIKGRGTNVFKLYEAIDTNAHRSGTSKPLQVAFYDDGIGTENLRAMRALSGAAGFGLGRNIRRLYCQLARVYKPHDEIYLFGFSRGAFTVRMLGRMIATVGILDLENSDPPIVKDSDLTKAVEYIYRAEFLDATEGLPWLNWLDKFTNSKLECYRFHKGIKIKFVGVWDTVDAVGFPTVGDFINRYLWRFKVTDCETPSGIANGCHALAIDDERVSFEPLLWCEQERGASKIKQVWFAGAHANVGGGYLRQGMSLVALDWMMAQAEACGLHFIDIQRKLYQELQNVDDRLYDPRSGIWLFYRWKPRNIVEICSNRAAVRFIHTSVFERISRRTEGYAPFNIPGKFEIEPMMPVRTAASAPEDEAKQLEKIINEHLSEAKRPIQVGQPSTPDNDSLLSLHPIVLKIGELSYWMFALATAALVLGIMLWASLYINPPFSLGDFLPDELDDDVPFAVRYAYSYFSIESLLLVSLSGVVLSKLRIALFEGIFKTIMRMTCALAVILWGGLYVISWMAAFLSLIEAEYLLIFGFLAMVLSKISADIADNRLEYLSANFWQKVQRQLLTHLHVGGS